MPKRKKRAESSDSDSSRSTSRSHERRSRHKHRKQHRSKHRVRSDPKLSSRSRHSRSARSNTPPLNQATGRLHIGSEHQLTRSTSSDHVNTENTNVNSRYVDSQQQFFEKFINVMQGIQDKPTPGRDKYPVLNNVLPEFDPLCKEQTIDSWIHKIEECAQIYSWDDKQIVHYALPKLAGIAKTWYHGLPSLLFSWSEWKLKLKESFPSRDNYAELLTEMLGKKARYGESLELYYYAKMNLLNRCEIVGKRAVDCLIFGIEDRGVRLGAQAVEFNEPEQILKFFKSVKTGQERNASIDIKNKDRRTNNYQGGSSNFPANSKTPLQNNTQQQRSNYNHIVCFNCNEKGHPFFRCTKPKNQCTLCNLRGHVSSDCPKKEHNNSSETKKVLRIESSSDSSLKYKMPLKINDKLSDCLVDLGCEGTLMRLSDAQRLQVKWEPVDGPILSGFGNTRFRPIGSALATIEVQGVTEKDVEMLIVDDAHINTPVMLGHTFTERPTIRITKTETDVIFQQVREGKFNKCMLSCASNITIASGKIGAIPVTSTESYSGKAYVNGTVRGCENKEHYLLPGEYDLKQGQGCVLVQNISGHDISFNLGDLITRALKLSECLQVNQLHKVSEPLTDESPLNIGDNISLDNRKKLEAFLESYKDCFSNSLSELGFTTESEMVIHLEDSNPVVYRPYRLAFTERQRVREMVQEMLDSGIEVLKLSRTEYMLISI